MHENRETSEAPAVQPGRRAGGEGLGRTAHTYVPEESHDGIVPMNYSNNDKASSAESREGRPSIKENAGQPSTHSTQSGERVSQGLAGVRKAARENKEMRFTALLHHLTVDLLRESFYSLKRKAAPGVDGVTWQEYETGLEDRLTDLHGRVHRGAYRALPSRRVYIEKEDGRKRALGVAALEDKLVQYAVASSPSIFFQGTRCWLRRHSVCLGHSDLTTTEVYVRADPTEKLEAIEAVVPPSLRKGKFRPPDKLFARLRVKP